MSHGLHVIIIGCGLAGPALAISLARRNITSTIYELRLTRSTSGGSISLGPNGLAVLDKYVGVYAQVESAGFTYTRFGAYFEDGEKFGEFQAGQEGVEGGYPAVRIMRSDLQDLLLNECESTRGIKVEWGKKLAEIRESGEGVEVHFEDGSSGKGDLLIGADGVHSQIRTHILGPTSPSAQFANTLITNGFLPRSSANTPVDFTFPAFCFTPAGMFMTIPVNPAGDVLAWGVNTPSPPRSRATWKTMESDGSASRLAKAGFEKIQTQPVRSPLDNAADEQSKIYTPHYVARLDRWYKGRSCLLGDAAHAMPPNGQGSSLAFEDIAILTRYLSHPKYPVTPSTTTTEFEQLFAKFQSVRDPRIDVVRKSFKAFNAARKSDGWLWVWWCKKWAFNTFLWWKGGVLDATKTSVYDVDHIDLRLD